MAGRGAFEILTELYRFMTMHLIGLATLIFLSGAIVKANQVERPGREVSSFQVESNE